MGTSLNVDKFYYLQNISKITKIDLHYTINICLPQVPIPNLEFPYIRVMAYSRKTKKVIFWRTIYLEFSIERKTFNSSTI